jgi:hypothetical protein
MENKPTMLQHTMTWGAITGIALIIYSLILYLAGQTFNNYLGWISYILLLAGIIMGTLLYRNKVLNGYISYGNAFLTGLLIIIFSAILSSFFSFILMRFIDPGLIEQLVSKTEEKLLSQGLNDDQIEIAVERMRKMMASPFSVILSLLGMIFIGTIISLITAAFIKKEGNTFEHDTQGV